MNSQRFWWILITACFGIVAWPTQAHKPSDSYLSVNIEKARLSGEWDIAVRDLESAIGLDANHDGEVTWGELSGRRAEVEAYALSRLQIKSDAAVFPLRILELLIDTYTDGSYAVLNFEGQNLCDSKILEIDYGAFFDLDPQHRGLFRLECQGQTQTGIFSPDQRSQRFDLASPNRGKELLGFVGQGIWHIWVGFDHILFLLALLLPAVLRRSENGWEVVDRFAPALTNVLKIVTAFTVAHSLTLSLGTLGVVKLNSRWVESVIAASVVFAALNNLRPFSKGNAWMIAFLFGLIHGFGFANVLADLGLSRGVLLLSLIGFNLGVEVGQLAIVALFLPLAFGLRRSWAYNYLTLKLGSAAIAMVATIWVVERMFEVTLLRL